MAQGHVRADMGGPEVRQRRVRADGVPRVRAVRMHRGLRSVSPPHESRRGDCAHIHLAKRYRRSRRGASRVPRRDQVEPMHQGATARARRGVLVRDRPPRQQLRGYRRHVATRSTGDELVRQATRAIRRRRR